MSTATEKKNTRTSPTFRPPKTPQLRRQPKYPWKSAPRRNQPDHHAIIQFPRTTESATKKTEENNDTLVFIVEVKADKHQVTQAVKKRHNTDMAKANPQSGLMEGRRHVSSWLQTMMLWKLPTKLGSLNLSPAG